MQRNRVGHMLDQRKPFQYNIVPVVALLYGLHIHSKKEQQNTKEWLQVNQVGHTLVQGNPFQYNKVPVAVM